MNWSAIVPLKAAAARKSRLAGHLPAAEIEALSLRMARTVIAALRESGLVPHVALLTPEPVGIDGAEWLPDRGLGLNAELEAARRHLGARRLIVIHADLPIISAADIAQLLAGADTSGLAIAPDRHEIGTNALALADDRPFRFGFGPDSFAFHRAQAGPSHMVVRTIGLGLDCDTAADLELVAANGFMDHPNK